MKYGTPFAGTFGMTLGSTGVAIEPIAITVCDIIDSENSK